MIHSRIALAILFLAPYAVEAQCGPGGCCPRPAFAGYQTMPAPVPQQMVDAEVRVHVGRAGGSGTIVAASGGEAIVITCRHVAACAGGVRATSVQSPKIGRIQAKNVWIDDRADLAAILIDLPQPPSVIPVADGDSVGMVWQVGFGVGSTLDNPWKRQGKVYGRSQFASRDNKQTNLHYDFLPRSGDSGSGLFTQDGKLAGVVWGYMSNHGCAVSVGDVRAFMTKSCPPWCLKPKRPDVGQKPPQIPDAPPAEKPVALEPLIEDVKALKSDVAKIKEDAAVQKAALASLTTELAAVKTEQAQQSQAIKAVSDNVTTLIGVVQQIKSNGVSSTPGPPGAAGPQGPAGPAGSPADMTRVKALEDEIALLKKQLAQPLRVRVGPAKAANP